MSRELSVWWDGSVVGALRIDRHGEMSFAYAAEWLDDPSRPPLSMSLPKRQEPFRRRACRPFFAGLLPEEGQLDAVARALGISKGNDFRLLEALGGDVAGALTLWPSDEIPPSPESGAREIVEERELVEILDTLPRRPLLAGVDGLRVSLAGSQSKLPIVLVGGRIALPSPGAPTTHVLKPALERFPATTENEALVMRLAKALDLTVAPVEARTVAGRPYLLVTRYDRRIDEAGGVRRLHQEDFCQALGIPPERKYAAEGGPTFKSAFDLLRRAATRPAMEILKLLDAAIFNVIVGNCDAHGKNFSLLWDDGKVTLAPLYDLLSTVAYPELSPRFAMKIAKAATLADINKETWTLFAADVGLGAPYVVRRVSELARAARVALPRVASQTAIAGINADAITGYADLIASRAERLAEKIR